MPRAAPVPSPIGAGAALTGRAFWEESRGMNKNVRIVLLVLLFLIAGFDLGLLFGPRLRPAKQAPLSTGTTLPPGFLSTVPDVRQSTNYSCGAAALQAVLSYYGIDKRERDLMEMLKTTETNGTSPDNIVRVARELGFQAEPRENTKYEDLVAAYRAGTPVILDIQAWTASAPENRAWAKDWEDGHYVVLLGADDEFIYVEDPSLLGTRGIIPKREFLDRWRDYLGDAPFDPSDRPYARLAIFISGKTPAHRLAFTKVD
jgi:uncharacterized protein